MSGGRRKRKSTLQARDHDTANHTGTKAWSGGLTNTKLQNWRAHKELDIHQGLRTSSKDIQLVLNTLQANPNDFGSGSADEITPTLQTVE